MTTISQNIIIYGIRATYDLSHEYRYIGLTKHGEARFKDHIRTAKTKNPKETHNPYLYHWIRKHFFQVTFDILEVCVSPEDLPLAERKWIHIMKTRGYRLANGTDGGEGTLGFKWSDEQKLEIGLRSSGENNGMYGYEWSDEQREAQRQRMLGRAPSSKGKSVPALQGPGNGMYGRKHTEEVKQKQSLRVALSNHTRWHVNRSTVKEGCIHCTST